MTLSLKLLGTAAVLSLALASAAVAGTSYNENTKTMSSPTSGMGGEGGRHVPHGGTSGNRNMQYHGIKDERYAGRNQSQYRSRYDENRPATNSSVHDRDMSTDRTMNDGNSYDRKTDTYYRNRTTKRASDRNNSW